MKGYSKYQYFRDVQLWPIKAELDYEGWLSNFKDETEQDIAIKILDFFVYFPDLMVDKMLQTVVGQCGYNFRKIDPSWSYDSFYTRCIYSFIPGETSNPTDSGFLFMRKLRDKLGISQSKTIDYRTLLDNLDNEPIPQYVILVDDFVGAGAQCDHAWNSIPSRRGKTLSQIVQEKKHHIIYAPLIMNMMGYERINNECKGLELQFVHTLSDEYNLFSEKCLCWENDIGKYRKGLQMITEKSRILGIPMSNPSMDIYYKGFGAQGLAIAFSHGIPDASIPLFYWDREGWIPLIKKHFHRN